MRIFLICIALQSTRCCTKIADKLLNIAGCLLTSRKYVVSYLQTARVVWVEGIKRNSIFYPFGFLVEGGCKVQRHLYHTKYFSREFIWQRRFLNKSRSNSSQYYCASPDRENGGVRQRPRVNDRALSDIRISRSKSSSYQGFSHATDIRDNCRVTVLVALMSSA